MSDAVISPKDWYQAVCDRSGFDCDDAQLAVMGVLQALWLQLVEFKDRRNGFLGRSLLSPEVPHGLYIWGGVGRGKTFLMDGFYECLPYRRKRRIHFHPFMLEVHQAMQQKAHLSDPLLAVAEEIARLTRVLCLDEFHVDDIADAMILGRLLQALFERGVVLVTTSNFAPGDLYPNGLQRQNFLPAIDLLQRELEIVHLNGGTDYRLMHMARDPLFFSPADAQSEARMLALYRRLTAGGQMVERKIRLRRNEIPVIRAAREAVWFDFAELCAGLHDQADYLELALRYPAIFLSSIPRLTAERGAEARRFAWLIDVLYDNHVKLVASFEVVPDRLYGEGEKDEAGQRIASRLAEMQTLHYLQQPHHSRRVTLTGGAQD